MRFTLRYGWYSPYVHFEHCVTHGMKIGRRGKRRERLAIEEVKKLRDLVYLDVVFAQLLLSMMIEYICRDFQEVMLAIISQ